MKEGTGEEIEERWGWGSPAVHHCIWLLSQFPVKELCALRGGMGRRYSTGRNGEEYSTGRNGEEVQHWEEWGGVQHWEEWGGGTALGGMGRRYSTGRNGEEV